MATASDALILVESSSPSGTITADESSDYNSLRTLTPQSTLDSIVSEPILSLLVDPIVSIKDLQRDAMVRQTKQRALSSDEILTSAHKTKLGGRGYSSMDALNDMSYTPRQSVTQQAVQLWNKIVYYLRKHISSGRRHNPLKFMYYRNCFFGSEAISCLKACLGHSINDERSLYVLCSKLLHAGVMECVEGNKLLFKDTELYRFRRTNSENVEPDSELTTRRRFIPAGLQTSTAKAMFSICQLWKKHMSSNRVTYPLPTDTAENNRSSTRRQLPQPRQSRCVYNESCGRPTHESSSFTNLLEYKSAQPDWVVYGFL